jgi:hypothetical protein
MSDGLAPIGRGARPFAVGLGPIGCGVRPIDDGLGPIGRGVRPIARGLDPIGCEARPIACGLGPIELLLEILCHKLALSIDRLAIKTYGLEHATVQLTCACLLLQLRRCLL